MMGSNTTLATTAISGEMKHVKENYPDFFVLGAAKCGTTSLHTWLDRHPDILMSDPKEPFFFEAEYEMGREYYWETYFQHWQGQPLTGDARHRNLYFPYIPERIKEFNPSARFILLLREPVARAHSHWWHWHRRGMDSLDFRAAVEADLKRIESGIGVRTTEEIAEYTRKLDAAGMGPYRTYMDSGYYAEQIERYLAIFPKECFKIVFFENLIRNPKLHVEDILRFLGADPGPAEHMDYRPENINKGISWRSARPLFLRQLGHAFLTAPLQTLTPSGFRSAVARPPIDQDTRQWLARHFQPHNARLAQLLAEKFDLRPPWI